ncbi:MAG: hypothetical protein JF590_00055, partial [Gemmatimonadetes bacterium]|nr:hypothetical protein [Gemmatimonadota bacterium]
MDLFLILFLVGFGGLALMAFSGLGRHHAGGAHHGGHASPHLGHHAHAGHGGHVHHGGGAVRGGIRSALLSWLSPRVLFAAALGG